jgi:hypothetical protein
MSVVRESMSMEVHIEALDLVDAALEAAHEDGELDAGLEEARAEVAQALADGEALRAERDRLERLMRRARIRLRRAERAQEQALRACHVDCMSAAGLNKEARVVKLMFDGGLSTVLKLVSESQNDATKERIALLGEHDVYEGALRDRHVPALQASVEVMTAALAARDKLTVALAGQAERELLWKGRVNVLRLNLSGKLLALGAERGDPAPRDYAPCFVDAGG